MGSTQHHTAQQGLLFSCSTSTVCFKHTVNDRFARKKIHLHRATLLSVKRHTQIVHGRGKGLVWLLIYYTCVPGLQTGGNVYFLSFKFCQIKKVCKTYHHHLPNTLNLHRLFSDYNCVLYIYMKRKTLSLGNSMKSITLPYLRAHPRNKHCGERATSRDTAAGSWTNAAIPTWLFLGLNSMWKET